MYTTSIPVKDKRACLYAKNTEENISRLLKENPVNIHETNYLVANRSPMPVSDISHIGTHTHSFSLSLTERLLHQVTSPRSLSVCLSLSLSRSDTPTPAVSQSCDCGREDKLFVSPRINALQRGWDHENHCYLSGFWLMAPSWSSNRESGAGPGWTYVWVSVGFEERWADPSRSQERCCVQPRRADWNAIVGKQSAIWLNRLHRRWKRIILNIYWKECHRYKWWWQTKQRTNVVLFSENLSIRLLTVLC